MQALAVGPVGEPSLAVVVLAVSFVAPGPVCSVERAFDVSGVEETRNDTTKDN